MLFLLDSLVEKEIVCSFFFHRLSTAPPLDHYAMKQTINTTTLHTKSTYTTTILRIIQVEAIKTLLEQSPNILPIACGGGGIPVSRIPSNPQTLAGVEAVIDKDACGAKLANELDADGYIILTDGGGIWQNYGKPDAREMKRASPEYLLGTKAGKQFPGSMGPKIQAAIDFVENSNKEGAWAAIGDLKDAAKIFSNEEGTIVREDVEEGVVWRVPKEGDRVKKEKKESKEPHKSG
jgi:carbamate kinase